MGGCVVGCLVGRSVGRSVGRLVGWLADFVWFVMPTVNTFRTALGAKIKPHKNTHKKMFVCLLVSCLTSQQHASVSQGRICSDNCTCCHTDIEVADHTFHFTGPTSPSADPLTPGAWQGSHWSASF